MTKQEIQEKIKNRVYEKSDADFFEDLVSAFNLDSKDKKVAKMYRLAWDNGHPYGYGEVMGHFEDLVEIFKDE